MDVLFRQCLNNHIHVDFCDTGASAKFKDVDEFCNFIKLCQDFAGRLRVTTEIPPAFLQGWDEAD